MSIGCGVDGVCEFSGCTASKRGGGLYVEASSVNASLSLLDVTFTRCKSCDSDVVGGSIYIECVDALTFITNTSHLSYTSLTDDLLNSFWIDETGVFKTRNTLSLSLLSLLCPPSMHESLSSVYVGGVSDEEEKERSDGNEYSTCGWNLLPCQKMLSAFNHAGYISHLILLPGTHTPEDNQLSFTNHSIHYFISSSSSSSSYTQSHHANVHVHPSKNVTRLSTTDSGYPTLFLISTNVTFLSLSFTFTLDSNNQTLLHPLFLLLSGFLNLSDVSITSASNTFSSLSPLPSSVIDAYSTHLFLSHVSITNLQFDSVPAIKTSNSISSLTITDSSSFTNLTRSNGSGALFDFTLFSDSSSSLTLNGTTFTNCTSLSPDAKAGAIYLSLSFEDASYSVVVMYTTFTSCFQSRTERNIQIDCIKAKSVLIRERWEGTITSSDSASEHKKFWMTEYSTDGAVTMDQSLYDLFFSSSSSMAHSDVSPILVFSIVIVILVVLFAIIIITFCVIHHSNLLQLKKQQAIIEMTEPLIVAPNTVQPEVPLSKPADYDPTVSLVDAPTPPPTSPSPYHLPGVSSPPPRNDDSPSISELEETSQRPEEFGFDFTEFLLHSEMPFIGFPLDTISPFLSTHLPTSITIS